MTLQPIGRLLTFNFNDTTLGKGKVEKRGTVFSDERGKAILNRFGNKVQIFVPPVQVSRVNTGKGMPQIPNPAAQMASAQTKAAPAATPEQ